jgi:DNA repair protein RadD
MMIPHRRQFRMVQRAVDALYKYGNTLLVAPTGTGKTVILSELVKSLLRKIGPAKALVLVHRSELLEQNRATFMKVNPEISTSVFDAKEKYFSGQAVFGMVLTLSKNLEQMPKFDYLIIDEAHHAATASYMSIIDCCRALNDKLQIVGCTATPIRGDGQGLNKVFDNVGDQITLGETVASGYLVAPKTYIIDVKGVTNDALQKVQLIAKDYDKDEVAAILNKSIVTAAVIKHWRALAGNRKTIVFCSTVAHAQDVCNGFVAESINAVLIHGELSDRDRKARLAEFKSGNAQVIVNVAVLTEGYDCPPIACVVLLRRSSNKSTFIQMVGRGLRTFVNSEVFPNIIKADCIVLDFGASSLIHGTLEQIIDDNTVVHTTGDVKLCPTCSAQVPSICTQCPICGHTWTPERPFTIRPMVRKEIHGDFVMVEFQLFLDSSKFRWCKLIGDDNALITTGSNAWGGIFFLDKSWFAVGWSRTAGDSSKLWKKKHQSSEPVDDLELLAVGDREKCIQCADDWLNSKEPNESAHYKTNQTLDQPPSDRQMKWLPKEMRTADITTMHIYSANLSYYVNKDAIMQLMRDHSPTLTRRTPAK